MKGHRGEIWSYSKKKKGQIYLLHRCSCMMSAARDSRRCFTGGTRRTQSIRDAETLPVDEEEQPDDEMFQDSRSARLIKTDKEECQSNEMSHPI